MIGALLILDQIPVDGDSGASQLVEFVVFDVKPVFPCPEGSVNDFHPALALMIQSIEPVVLPLNTGRVAGHAFRYRGREVLDGSQPATSELPVALRQSLDQMLPEAQEVAPCQLVVALFAAAAQRHVEVVAVDIHV